VMSSGKRRKTATYFFDWYHHLGAGEPILFL